MPRTSGKLTLVFLLSVISLSAVAQPGKIEIRYLGNCGFFMTDGKMSLCVDFPYEPGAYGYMTYSPGVLDSIPVNSLYLFTHGHADHYNKKLFREKKGILYAPWPVRIFLPGKRKYSFKELNGLLPGFSVTKYRTGHRFSLRHYSYLIVWNGKRIFISGDTGDAGVISRISDMDLVIAPTWFLHDAFSRDLKIDAKKIILCHLRSDEKVDNRSPEKIIAPVQNQVFELN